MADIDHFKNINDTYGHQFGDIVLNIISQSLKQGLRNTDIIGRYGGEEIFFVIKGALLENVITKLNQLLLKIQNTVIPRLDSYVTSPTISFGAIHVAKADIEHLADDSSALLSDLISKADKALYYSKENGRNQYTIDSYANGKTYTRVFNEAIQERRKPDVQSV
jgi:diguanylate cyclase (GGDEF)-like protein